MINIVKDLSVKHVLIFVIIAFLLYHIIGNCGYRDGFSVGGQKCSEYDTKVACDGPCKWDDNTNTCSEKSEFCKVNSLCSDGSKCPDCGATYCECPPLDPPGYCDCTIGPGDPQDPNYGCFNYSGKGDCPGRPTILGHKNSCYSTEESNHKKICERTLMDDGKTNLCKWHIK